MAENEWIGVNGNYSDGGNWSQGAAPTAGQDVHFTGASNQSVTSGLAQGAVGLTSFNVHEDYTGTIASSGSKLVHDSITTVRINTRSGKVYLESDATITNAIVEGGGGIDYIELDAVACTDLDIVGASGSMSITSGAAVSHINLSKSPGMVLTLNTGITGIVRITQNSGRILNGSNVSATAVGDEGNALLVLGGIHELTDAAAVANPMIIANGGTVIDRSSGTKEDVIALDGGIFDGRQNRNRPDVAVTLARVYPGGRILLRNALDTYGTSSVKSYGGTYDAESGVAV